VTRTPAGELRTERLLLRRWRAEDDAPMTAINRDPEVARYLNRQITEAALAAFYPYLVEHWERHGFGPWAVESREPIAARPGAAPIEPGPAAIGPRSGAIEPGTFLGFAGVAFPTYLPALADEPEIGWRLTRAAWGRGLATEAALAARDHAFGLLGLPALIAIVHPDNARSQSVARKLGMAVERHVHNPLLERFVEVWELAAPSAG
jgi:RimJ/RimL family protein N-acetyltransferase